MTTPPPLAAWGLSGDIRPLHGGHRNTVLRVGDHVLKTTRRTEPALQWLTDVQEVAAGVGLHAPRLMQTAKGRLSVQGWTCEPFFEGVETAPDAIAKQIAVFHKASAHLPQRPGFASARDLLHMPKGGDIDLSVMPDALVKSLRRIWGALPTAQVVVHADLNPSNILRNANGTVALIDWDEARRDAPLFDLGAASHPMRQAWEIACCWQIEPERARHLAHLFAG